MDNLGGSEEAGGPPPLPPPPPTIPLNVKPKQVTTHKNTITGRHGVESTGQSIQLLSNHFKVDVSDASVFYQYSVSITAEENRVVEGRGIRRKVIEKLFQKNDHKLAEKRFAYDGEKSLYTVGPLPLNLFESQVVLEEVSKSNTGSPGGSGSPSGSSKKSRLMFQSKNFNANISNAFKVPLNGQDTLRVLNTVLRQQAANRELLLDFYQMSNRKPTQIIVFRDGDGVSESQFNQVLGSELDQIRRAYQNLWQDINPKLTMIVAQKNHHTKLFQADSLDNIPPGTVVDTKIVHPENYNFYMCAHAGMVGTSRPAHYRVLCDEIGFRPDQLQDLIHSLSYVYQRSTTAISIVAPIRYAHLAAQQMGQIMKFEDFLEHPKAELLPGLHKSIEGSMFFC